MVVAWWKEPTLVLCNNKNKPTVERTMHLQQNVALIGLFFGSFRNRSTKHFIKYLDKFYSYTKEKKENFEIIYVSLDEDEPDCEFFVKSMMGDWLTVPWGNQGLRRNARNMYNVLDQPWLVIVKNDDKGRMVAFDGKSDLLDYGYFCLQEWQETARNIVPPPDTSAQTPKAHA